MVLVRILAASLDYNSRWKASSLVEHRTAQLSTRRSVKIPPVHQTYHRSRMPRRVLNAAFYSFLCLSHPRTEIAIVRDGKASDRRTASSDHVLNSRRAQSRVCTSIYNKTIPRNNCPLKTRKKNPANLILVPSAILCKRKMRRSSILSPEKI